MGKHGIRGLALVESARLAWSQGDASMAANLVTQAIALCKDPPPPAWLLLLADALSRLGRVEEASRAYQDCSESSPGEARAWRGLARCRHVLGDLRGAARSYERALSLDSAAGAWELWSDLGSTRMEMRDWQGAREAFEHADRLRPGQALVAVNRGNLEVRQGRIEPAIAMLSAAVQDHPEYAPAHAALGFALRDAHRYEQAAGALRRATELDPSNHTFACGLGRVFLEAGRPESALAQALALLARRPGYAGARALETLARVALGDADGVAPLLDYECLVRRATLATPEGFSDLHAFNAALAEHACSHPTLMQSPYSHATQDGLHSGSLLVAPRGPVTGLERAVKEALSAYGRERSGSRGNPFLDARPEAGFLRMWAVVLQRGGHQIPHIHPEAWLSGVYYPQLTASIRSGRDPAGWLEFGQPDLEFPAKMSAPTLAVRPEEGLLVLFPSYLYHRTIPFEGDGTRVSVAFDFVPIRRSG